MKKTEAPKVLLILLLLIAGSFLVVASGTKLGDVLFPSAQAGEIDTPSDTPQNSDIPKEPSTSEFPSGGVTEPPATLPSEPVFPIPPLASERYAFEQSVTGNLMNSLYTANGYFLFVREDGENYLYRMGEDGTLLERVKAGEGELVDLKPTDHGITALFLTERESVVRFFDSITLERSSLALSASDSASLYVLSEGFLVRLGERLCFVKEGVVRAEGTLPSERLVALFRVGSGYTAICNTESGFETGMYDLEFRRYATVTIVNRSALAFSPVPTADGLRYAVLERESDMLYLTLYAPSFHLASAERVSLGKGEDGALFANDSHLIVLAKGSETRLYASDFDLNFSRSDAAPFAGASEIYSVEAYGCGSMILMRKGESLCLLDVRADGTTALHDLGAEEALAHHRTKNGVTLFSSKPDEERVLIRNIPL